MLESSCLVRAKLYPLERKRGSYMCRNSRCQMCNNIEETDTFSRTVTGEISKFNHDLCCNDKCFIYLLTRKVCGKQYTGKTDDKFRPRWNNYKDSDTTFLRVEEVNKSFKITLKMTITVLKNMVEFAFLTHKKRILLDKNT